jgi:hypothetical protein
MILMGTYHGFDHRNVLFHEGTRPCMSLHDTNVSRSPHDTPKWYAMDGDMDTFSLMTLNVAANCTTLHAFGCRFEFFGHVGIDFGIKK